MLKLFVPIITVQGLKESAGDASVGVKMMADFDTKPFIGTTQRMPTLNFSERVKAKAMEVGSLWEENLKDPSWHPFKFIMDEEGKTRVDILLSSRYHISSDFVVLYVAFIHSA